jgi:hypothetical protein
VSKIENATSDLPGHDMRPLRDEELNVVTGGFVVDWSNQRGIVVNWMSSDGYTPVGR